MALLHDQKSPLDTILTLRPPHQTEPEIRFTLRLTRYPGRPITCIDRPHVRLGNRLLGPVYLRAPVPASWEPYRFYSCQLVWHPELDSLVLHEEKEGPLLVSARSITALRTRGYRRSSLLKLLVAEGHLPEKGVPHPSIRYDGYYVYMESNVSCLTSSIK
jgi:hypothetical protein